MNDLHQRIEALKNSPLPLSSADLLMLELLQVQQNEIADLKKSVDKIYWQNDTLIQAISAAFKDFRKFSKSLFKVLKK